ncbi:MAG: aminodeoxychorismate synthase component I, partial [Terrimesophilobacter sp.]
VVTSLYGGWVDPSACFAALASNTQDADAASLFWLDSGIEATSGMSCMGRGSRTVTYANGVMSEVSLGRPAQAVPSGSVFEFLRAQQSQGVDSEASTLAFSLGWVGWLGYELHELTLGAGLGRSLRYPDAALLFADRAIVFDHFARTVTLAALGESWSGELAAWKDETTRMLHTLAAASAAEGVGSTDTGQHPEWAYSDTEYLAMIEQCQRSIRAGDAYQLCLTTEVTLDVHPDPVETYLRLRTLSPSHHGGFLRIGGVSLLSSSPETFLTVSPGGEIESKPIKGTRKRGETPEDDAALRAELVSSDKERAENLMIVDLVRNDMSRVCEVGSVWVPALLQVESYAHVHQLVSTVRGKLAAGCDAIDAVMACFPAGSMTGAPKLSAVRILDELEERARGIYSGAWGYFGLDGSVDLAMTIRSIVIDSGGISIGTGGGITALSVPSEELEETRIKAAALLRALGLVTL